MGVIEESVTLTVGEIALAFDVGWTSYTLKKPVGEIPWETKLLFKELVNAVCERIPDGAARRAFVEATGAYEG